MGVSHVCNLCVTYAVTVGNRYLANLAQHTLIGQFKQNCLAVEFFGATRNANFAVLKETLLPG